MTGKKRAAAILLVLFFCLGTAGSLFCLICNADHTCAGEDCVVCLQIRLCEDCLRVLSLLAVGVFLYRFVCNPDLRISVRRAVRVLRPDPVFCKVKLSD